MVSFHQFRRGDLFGPRLSPAKSWSKSSCCMAGLSIVYLHWLFLHQLVYSYGGFSSVSLGRSSDQD